MEMILATLGVSLGTALLKVIEEIAKKLVDAGIEPSLEIAKKKLTAGYNAAKAAEELRDKTMAALDAMRAETPDPFERLKITNWVTGQDAGTYDLLAATSIEMVDVDPGIISSRLLTALGIDEDRRDLLAQFLVYLRRELTHSVAYGPLITYANDLDRRGLLKGLTHQVESIGQDTRKLVSYLAQWIARQGLTDNDAGALKTYLEHCRSNWSQLMLPIVRKNVGPLSPELKRIFVPLQVRDERAEEAARKTAEKRKIRSRLDEGIEQIQPVDFYTAMAKYRRFVLVGMPGTGKTTLLRRAALAFAEGRATEDLGWQGEPKLPIFIRLRNFGIYLAENRSRFSAPGPGALVAFLEQNLQNDQMIKIPEDFLKRRLQDGECMVLLDGLDEVLENRAVVAQSVNAFIKEYGQGDNWIGISSRPRGYTGDARLQLAEADLALLEVLPLGPNQIRELIKNVLPLLESKDAQRQKDLTRLSGRILSNKNLTEIASVPMFCAALVQVYKYHGADLPQRRVDVLAEIVDLLLGFWYAQSSELLDPITISTYDGTGHTGRETEEAVEQKFNYLAHLAYYMQAELEQVEITTEQARKRLAKYIQEQEGVPADKALEWARGFLRSAHEQSGLFVENSPGSHSFLHKNFLEFFAASSLLKDQDNPIETVKAYLDNKEWEEVLLFTAAHPAATNRFRSNLIPAILACAENCEAGTEAWARRLAIAGRMASDMTTRLPAEPRSRIADTLYTAATNPQLAPPLRAELADTLDGFWSPADLYTFLPLPGSKGETFYMGRYPVTNAQYERFLQPENFGEAGQAYWQDFPQFDEHGQPIKKSLGLMGWKWLQTQSEERLAESGVLLPRYWRDPRFGIMRPGAPVVGVTWYEANAYCRWLLAHWEELEEGRQGLPRPRLVRLPVESEWEIAAGGLQPEDRYPWDGKKATNPTQEILKKANITESKINRTTPVWMYPQGKSTRGIWDMAGNVWEWQVNYFDKDHDSSSLRGGSWGDDGGYARCAARYRFGPGCRRDHIGFRVSLSLL